MSYGNPSQRGYGNSRTVQSSGGRGAPLLDDEYPYERKQAVNQSSYNPPSRKGYSGYDDEDLFVESRAAAPSASSYSRSASQETNRGDRSYGTSPSAQSSSGGFLVPRPEAVLRSNRPAARGYEPESIYRRQEERRDVSPPDYGRQYQRKSEEQPRRVVNVSYDPVSRQLGDGNWRAGSSDSPAENRYEEEYDVRYSTSGYSGQRAPRGAETYVSQGESYDGQRRRQEKSYDDYDTRRDELYAARQEDARRREMLSAAQQPLPERMSQAGLLGVAPQQELLQQLVPQAQAQLASLATSLIGALVQGQQQAVQNRPLREQPYSMPMGNYGPPAGYGSFERRPVNMRADGRGGPPPKQARGNIARWDSGNRKGGRVDDNEHRARSPDRKRKVPVKKQENRKDDAKGTQNKPQANTKNDGGKTAKADHKGKRHPRDEEDRTAYKDVPKKYLFCHICFKNMWNGPSFERHISGGVHKEVLKKTENVYLSRVDAMRLTSQMAEAKREAGDFRKGQRQEHCQMCDAYFSGNLLAHRKSKPHLMLKNFLHPKCGICKEDFHSRIERDEHLLTAKHMKKVFELEGDESKAVPALEEDEGIDETYNPENPTVDEEDKQLAAKEGESLEETGGTTDKVAKKIAFVKDKNIKTRSVFYCKVCNIFFNYADMAYDRHCRSSGHHEQYGRAIAVKLGMKKIKEEEKEKKVQKETPVKKKREEDSDDDGNWKRRGAKKHDDDESLSQETEIDTTLGEPESEPMEAEADPDKQAKKPEDEPEMQTDQPQNGASHSEEEKVVPEPDHQDKPTEKQDEPTEKQVETQEKQVETPDKQIETPDKTEDPVPVEPAPVKVESVETKNEDSATKKEIVKLAEVTETKIYTLVNGKPVPVKQEPASDGKPVPVKQEPASDGKPVPVKQEPASDGKPVPAKQEPASDAKPVPGKNDPACTKEAAPAVKPGPASKVVPTKKVQPTPKKAEASKPPPKPAQSKSAPTPAKPDPTPAKPDTPAPTSAKPDMPAPKPVQTKSAPTPARGTAVRGKNTAVRGRGRGSPRGAK